MANEAIHIPSEQNLDYQMVAHIVEGLKKEQKTLARLNSRIKAKTELRMLTFWRAIFFECLASFLYVFIVCGAAAGAGTGASFSTILMATSLASGLTIAVLTHCLIHVSGAHINPAVTVACFCARLISPLRMFMYVAAQLGGGIAGAALLYGVSSNKSNLQAAISTSQSVLSFERLGVEVILTSFVVFTYFVSTNTHRKLFGNSAVMVGAAYSACNFVSMPYLNPARALGPSFVMSQWENHWIYWAGPLFAGAVSGFLLQMVFKSKKCHNNGKDSEESSSMNSDEDINYDLDIEKSNPLQPKFHAGNYNTYRSSGQVQKHIGPQNICQATYQSKLDRVEAIYGGTRSLYCKSPSMTRSNLSRSQSVYTKSNGVGNRDNGVIRAGPLVPAQSLYPLRVAAPSQQNTHLQNQNVQNQLQQRSESIYGIRGSMRQSNGEQRMPERQQAEREPPSVFQPIYASRNNPTPNDAMNYEAHEEPVKYTRRPESTYGMTNRRIQSAQSDDSSYGSYHGSSLTPPTRGSSQNGNFQPNGSLMNQKQQQQQQQMIQGMLPLSNTHSHHPQHQPQHQNHHPTQQQNQNERKLSTSTTSSLQIQRNVEFKDVSLKTTSGPTQSPLPPPPTHQNYQMHPIRQH